MKIGYYQADTVHGVYFVGESFEDDAYLMTASAFAETIRSLRDGVVVVAFFDEATAEILAEIDEEFGVH